MLRARASSTRSQRRTETELSAGTPGLRAGDKFYSKNSTKYDMCRIQSEICYFVRFAANGHRRSARRNGSGGSVRARRGRFGTSAWGGARPASIRLLGNSVNRDGVARSGAVGAPRSRTSPARRRRIILLLYSYSIYHLVSNADADHVLPGLVDGCRTAGERPALASTDALEIDALERYRGHGPSIDGCRRGRSSADWITNV